jgi:hypothetical protein
MLPCITVAAARKAAVEGARDASAEAWPWCSDCAKAMPAIVEAPTEEDTRSEVISTDARAFLDSVGRLRRSLAVGRALIDLYGRKPESPGEQKLLAPPEQRDA